MLPISLSLYIPFLQGSGDLICTSSLILHLKDTNKIATIYEATNADFKIIEHTLEMPDLDKKESVSSQETGTSGFVSDGGISAQQTFLGL